jgi:Ca2+/H+ antiporter
MSGCTAWHHFCSGRDSLVLGVVVVVVIITLFRRVTICTIHSQRIVVSISHSSQYFFFLAYTTSSHSISSLPVNGTGFVIVFNAKVTVDRRDEENGDADIFVQCRVSLIILITAVFYICSTAVSSTICTRSAPVSRA